MSVWSDGALWEDELGSSKHDSDQYDPEETARRRDEAIRRALNTPPKPQKEIAGKSGRPPRKRSNRSRPIEKK
jgi:hypothetical protein